MKEPRSLGLSTLMAPPLSAYVLNLALRTCVHIGEMCTIVHSLSDGNHRPNNSAWLPC
ncbi:hypothetical protein Ade02nite_86730 [Paractinoplanes deccanensis]|uniref:Uncharacterized protein n=1 Tax=Paractinoplanes deccanensis TaxID=113561 RepID=A0ABQ3YJ84_9ACTN|nr:hypothetical protein Ade02nite_86730 [Actinoplanes deccanensis]